MQKRRISLLYGVFLLIGLVGLSCSDQALIDKNLPIANRKWDYENQPKIDVHIADASQPYKIYLNLRHTADYKFSNLFVLLHQRSPAGKDSTQRFEFRLAAPDGRWLGKGAGSVYTHQQLIKENYRFPDTGKFVYSLEQNMRETPLAEIVDVGIRIEPVD